MKLTVKHTTSYSYAAPVEFALQKLRMHPMASALQSVLEWQVEIDGGKIETRYQDHYGNHVDLVSANAGVQTLTIQSSGTVETRDTAGVLGRVYGCAPLWHFAQTTPLTEPGDAIRALAEPFLQAGADKLSALHALSAAVLEAVPYKGGHTDARTTAEQSVGLANGVCQDHANIFVSIARLGGMPARYVSGYLLMNDRVDQDASHAWAEVHLDNLGWVAFDVSNGVCPDDRYIRVATGRDAHDAAPVYGLRGGAGDENLIVSLQVQQ